MNSVLLTQLEEITVPPDDFYFAVRSLIDNANPRAHLSRPYGRNPLALGLMIYPLRVYETIRKLKEQNDGNRASS